MALMSRSQRTTLIRHVFRLLGRNRKVTAIALLVNERYFGSFLRSKTSEKHSRNSMLALLHVGF